MWYIFSKHIHHVNTKNNNEEMNSFIHPDEGIRNAFNLKGAIKTIFYE